MLTHLLKPPAYYSYHPDTGEFMGTGLCELSPARYPRGHEFQGHLVEPDVPIVPGSSTLIEPPPTKVHEVAVWDEAYNWIIRPDYRGEVRYRKGEFMIVTSFGEPSAPPLQVHDAQYLFADGDVLQPTIRMWINDDVIEFVDDPNILPRQVLARWEEAGETIRPVDMPEGEWAPEELLPPPHTDEEHRAKLDAYVRSVVEGSPIPHQEPLL